MNHDLYLEKHQTGWNFPTYIIKHRVKCLDNYFHYLNEYICPVATLTLDYMLACSLSSLAQLNYNKSFME